jgi:hypothetical protein
MVVQDDEHLDDETVVVLAGPQAAATLDQIANAAESTRPHEDDMFSPRSSAALTLTSIAMQPPLVLPQPQALFSSLTTSPSALFGPPAGESSTTAATTTSIFHQHVGEEEDDDDDDDYFMDAKQAFLPPRETFVAKPNHVHMRSRSESVANYQQHKQTINAAAASTTLNTKIRHVSVGSTISRNNNADIENNPNQRITGGVENHSTTEQQHPLLRSSSRESFFSTMPFSSSTTHHPHHHSHSHSVGPSVVVNSYTIGPCAFSVTRSNPPPATAADFLPPSWDNAPRYTSDANSQRHRNHQSIVPSASYSAPNMPTNHHHHNQWEVNSQQQQHQYDPYGMVRTPRHLLCNFSAHFLMFPRLLLSPPKKAFRNPSAIPIP